MSEKYFQFENATFEFPLARRRCRCLWQSDRAVRQREQGMIRPPSLSSSHLQWCHHPHPCSLQAADVWPKPDNLRFIEPNFSNAPLHILSNGNGVATMGKVIN